MWRRKPSWLDQWVYRFQHRWETNAQYRAAVSGVCGLVLIVLMCSCTGLLATVANAGLAGLGGGGGANGGTGNTGTKQLGSVQSFPTSTIPPYTVATIPSGNIPDSQTPGPTPTIPPAPTDVPTATPCQTGCGGGGGGGGGGGSGSVSATASPTPWRSGAQGQVNVSTSSPNIPINIIISFPNGATVLNNGAGQTDGSGNYTFAFTVPSGLTGGTAHAVIEAGYSSGIKYKDVYQPCAA